MKGIIAECKYKIKELYDHNLITKHDYLTIMKLISKEEDDLLGKA